MDYRQVRLPTIIANKINVPNVTVITNSLDIANVCAEKPNVQLFMTGGNFAQDFRAFEGIITVENFRSYYYDVSFIGVSGISVEMGIGTSTQVESAAKQAIIRNSYKSYVVAESQKFNKRSRMTICDFNDVTGIITNDTSLDSLKEYKNLTNLYKLKNQTPSPFYHLGGSSMDIFV